MLRFRLLIGRVSPHPKTAGRAAVLLALVCVSLGLGACGHAPPVQPWQREHLSRRSMSFDDGLEAMFRQHAFGSREGADGGSGQVGGGCGCN